MLDVSTKAEERQKTSQGSPAKPSLAADAYDERPKTDLTSKISLAKKLNKKSQSALKVVQPYVSSKITTLLEEIRDGQIDHRELRLCQPLSKVKSVAN